HQACAGSAGQQITHAGYRQSCGLLAYGHCPIGQLLNGVFLVIFQRADFGFCHRAGSYGACHLLPPRARPGRAARRRRIHVDRRSLPDTNVLLIRDRTAFEEARRTQAIVFDKTGTLTKGEFGITDFLVLDKAMKEDELLAYAAAIERYSEHPIAKGIVKSAKD